METIKGAAMTHGYNLSSGEKQNWKDVSQIFREAETQK
jgi:hypothetical protein